MKPPAELSQSSAERVWITDGPSSGGIRGWLLYAEHLFPFWHEGPTGGVGDGLRIADFRAAHAGTDEPRLRAVVDELCALGGGDQES